MNKAFTDREKTLLVILAALILCAVYYFLLYQTVQARIDEAHTRNITAQDTLALEQTRSVKLTNMEKELDRMKATGKETLSATPDYNNLRNVMLQLDAILGLADSYDISFSDIVVGDRFISRPIKIQFTSTNYAAAKQIVTNLSECSYRCTINSVDMKVNDEYAQIPDVKSDLVNVSVSVTFYEKNTMPKVTAPAENPPS